MSVSLQEQISTLFSCLAMGLGVGLLYDLLRLVRLTLPRRTLQEILDLLFWLGACGMLFFCGIVFGNGRVRLYMALCLLLGGCSMDRGSSSSSGAEDLIVMEGISPGEETPPSRIWIPLGVYSGKTPGGTAELPDGFICTQPLTNCYQSEINSENER